MPTDDSKPTHSFQDLEKQLAKDTLEKALKDLQGEINEEIERNKETFSDEIKQTLNSFKKDLERSVSEEMDKKLSSLFKKHFKETSLQVKGSFEEIFDPVLKATQDDMNRLQSQGESTLCSWKGMMAQYESLWTRPFILVFFASAFTGMLIFLVSTYFLWSTYSETIKGYEKRLSSNENLLLWYFEKYKESPEYIEAEKQKQSTSMLNRVQKLPPKWVKSRSKFYPL